ncbi:MAG: DUF1156 domain-containing protein [Anaerohalosphaeraceae bacterium]
MDFPIAVVSKHSAREKSIRHGHPSTLHLWWARRPLAACRAMLLGLLLPDPCDPRCPPDFKEKARSLLQKTRGNIGPNDLDLRTALLDFIGDFADWDNSSHPVYLEVGRGLVKAAWPEETPLVVDPFAGGGSIPLEALRLGCEAFASDLNPVACLILKVMLEDIPRHGPQLAEELRRVGNEIKEKAKKELAEFYPCLPAGRPKNPDEATPNKYYAYVLRCCDGSLYKGHTDDLPRRFKQHCEGLVEWTKTRLPVDLLYWDEYETREEAIEREKWLKSGVGREWLAQQFPKEKPIAYLWARTVRCESPNCGAEIPLMRSFWLCKKANRKKALRYTGTTDNLPQFEIFEPETDKEVQNGTVTRAKATCLACGTVLSPERVRAQLAAQHGGANAVFDAKGNRIGGARLLAVVTLREGQTGRYYRLPTKADYQAVYKAQQKLKKILDEWERNGKKGLCPVPDEPTPVGGGSGAGRAFSVQKYGMLKWGDLFTARQKLSLITIAYKIMTVREKQNLAIVLSRITDLENSLCGWRASSECIDHLFARQALPIVWDFGEASPMAGATGSWDSLLDRSAEGYFTSSTLNETGLVQQADACQSPLPEDSVSVWFTDPPYYDAIPYSDLSDFFFVWLKRTLPGHPLLRDPFDPQNGLSPKAAEIVQDETKKINSRCKDRAFFEEAMGKAFAEGRRILKEDGISSVVFAHKTTEGWEALLTGLIHGGWTITGSWPIATEMESRLRARDSAALATSIHLVCRPRPEDAPVGDWGEVLRELPKRVGDWMERLQAEGIRGADLVFACIGPALEIYSRYSRVETADGRPVSLAEFLEKVWEVVGRIALEQVLGTAEAKARNGVAGALEEDARLTALFLWTLQSTNGRNGPGREAGEEADDEAGDDEDEEETAPKGKAKGFSLVFDVVRRFAQPLGIDLSKWEGRIIKTEKGVVRLLPVAERAKQLFGEEGARAAATWVEQDPTHNIQPMLFSDMEDRAPKIRGRRGKRTISPDASEIDVSHQRTVTTLDRVHAAMLLQAGGQTNALRALIQGEQQRGPDFLRLANALSALYPKDSEEKRLLDAMLLAVPR